MTATNLPVFEPAPAPLREPGELSVLRGDKPMPLPLESISYRATVLDRIADVTLTQEFTNPYAEHLEATYTFPLAAGAAVRSFELTVAGRTIRAVVKERGQAREEYQQALDAGKRAALLEQERDNVFTIQVGNLPPGEKATVTIAYCERLEISNERQVELRLPTVIAPRYVTGSELGRSNSGTGVEDDTDAVGDASRVTPPRLVGKGNVKLDVEVTLSSPAGGIADLACSQHATSTSFENNALRVSLSRDDEQPDRDVVLRWRLSTEEVKGSLSTYASKESIYGMLTLIAPPASEQAVAHRDVVFLLDHSGSMQGIKMQSAIRACKQLLESLTPTDRYAVAIFNTTISWLGSTEKPFVPADIAGKSKGIAYLDAVTANGGTEIEQSLASVFEAIRRRREHEGRMPVVVLITDGEVANEHQVLKRIQREIGDTRLFAVGIDTAVNDALLKRMAALGRGTAALVEPGAELERTLASVAREIGTPEVVDLSIDDIDAGVDTASLVPHHIPDLFSGRASTVFLKLGKTGTLRIRGKRADGSEWSQAIEAKSEDVPAIANLWARGQVTELEDAFRIDTVRRDELQEKIIALSIEHAIVTRFTAMLAVDEQEVVNPDGSRKRVTQPVNMPAQWEMSGPRDLLDSLPIQAAYSVPPPPPMQAGTVMRGDLFAPASPMIASPAPPKESKGLFQKLFQRAEKLQTHASPTDLAGVRAKLREIVKLLKSMRDNGVDDGAALERLRLEAVALIGTDPRISQLVNVLDRELPGAMIMFQSVGHTHETHALIGRLIGELEETWMKKLGSLIGDGGTFWGSTV